MNSLFLTLISITGIVAASSSFQVIHRHRHKRGSSSTQTSLSYLEVSPTVLTHVSYGAIELSIFEHRLNSERPPEERVYYSVPLAAYSPADASCRRNVFSSNAQATFLHVPIVMWSDDAVAAMLQHLRRITGNEQLRSWQIQMLPIESYQWSQPDDFDEEGNKNSMFQVDNKWKTYTKKRRTIVLRLLGRPQRQSGRQSSATTPTRNESLQLCRQGLSALGAEPDSLAHSGIELKLSLTGTRSYRKRVRLSGNLIKSTRLFAELQNFVNTSPIQVPMGSNVYLRSSDMNTFGKQMSQRIVANMESDSEYVDTDGELSIQYLVDQMLKEQSEAVNSALLFPTSTNGHFADWGSVFWRPEHARPDRVSSELNRVIKKTSDSSGNISVDLNALKEFEGGAGRLGIDILGVGGGDATAEYQSNSASVKHLNESVARNIANASGTEIQWNGDRYVPKPIQLHRINLGELASKLSLVSTNVKLHTINSVYAVSLTHVGDLMPSHLPDSDNGTVDLTSATSSNVNARIDDIEGTLTKLDDNVGEVKSEIMAGIATNLTKFRADVVERIDGLETEVQSLASKIKISRKLRDASYLTTTTMPLTEQYAHSSHLFNYNFANGKNIYTISTKRNVCPSALNTDHHSGQWFIFNGNCYFTSCTSTTDYFSGLDKCSSFRAGCSLTSIKNETENAFLVSALTPRTVAYDCEPRVWMGLVKAHKGYIWLRDAGMAGNKNQKLNGNLVVETNYEALEKGQQQPVQSLEYSNWNHLQPSTEGGSHCGMFNAITGQWALEPCQTKHAFVCKCPVQE